MAKDPNTRAVTIPAGEVELAGDLTVPEGAQGMVLFAHGSGSSRHSPRKSVIVARGRPIPKPTKGTCDERHGVLSGPVRADCNRRPHQGLLWEGVGRST